MRLWYVLAIEIRIFVADYICNLMKLSIFDNTLPLWLRRVSWVFLTPVPIAPFVFIWTIMNYDGPTNELERIGMLLLFNSYSLWLIGVVQLGAVLYRRYHKVLISIIPHAILVLIIGLLITWLALRPAGPSTLDGYRYTIYRDTPAAELATAVEDNDTMEIDRILYSQPKLVNFQDTLYGQSMLRFACLDGNVATVKSLLRHGAKPNLSNWYDGKTPLISLCEIPNPSEEQLKIAEILLQRGATVKPIKSYLKDFKRLPDSEDDTISLAPLDVAAGRGSLSMMKLLLKHGADVNYQEYYTANDSTYKSYSAVTIAMIGRRYEIVTYLLEHGANPFLTFYEDNETLLSMIEKSLKDPRISPYDREQTEKIKHVIKAYKGRSY